MNSKLYKNEDCSFMVKNDILYFSLSFENLNDLKNCNDYMFIKLEDIKQLTKSEQEIINNMLKMINKGE